MAYTRPTKGTVNYGTTFGEWKYPEHETQSKVFAKTPGAGLYAIGLDPNSPTLEQDAQRWYANYKAKYSDPSNRNYNKALLANQFGREDAKMLGVPGMLAKNPNGSLANYLDTAIRGDVAQVALPKREFDIMTVLDPIIEAGLGFINPALSVAYGGIKGGVENGLIGGLLGGLGGYGAGTLGAGIGQGIQSAGSVGSYLSNLPHNALNALRYGPEIGSEEFASYFPGGAAEPILNNINTTALFPNAAWVSEGAQAGLSNAARAASAIGTANTLSKGAGALGTQAGAKGGAMSWFDPIKDTLKTLKSDWGITGGDILRGSADLASGYFSSKAAKDAAKLQANAATASGQLASQTADKQMALLEKMFNKQVALQEPFRQGGVAAENRMLDLLGLGANKKAPGYGSLAKNFGMSDFQADPGYAFRMREGLKALDRQAAARGGLISGGALKAAQNYGQDLASQEYQNAYNRYQTNRTNLLNPLQSLAGAGQTSANTIGNAAENFGMQGSNALGGAGTAQANAIQNAANARASGYLGSQQSWNSALQNVAAIPGQAQQNAFMNALMQKYLNAPSSSGNNFLSYAGVV